jgi:RNA polymerase sigma-70 factor (ECF subfamily)
MDERELARRVIAGHEPAAEEFFHEYFPRLYRFACARLGGDDDAVEEVVQATLILALRKLDTWRGEAALFTWLCTLCRHEIGAWLQKHRRADRPLPLDDDPGVRQMAQAVAAWSAGADANTTHFEISRLVQVTLDQLPARYGQVLEWKYVQGLAVGEIADRLGLGYKAAESLLTRARVAFREGYLALAGEWPLEGRR